MKTQNKNIQNVHYASLVLRLGLGFVFAYAAIDAIREPDAWIGFVPSFTNHILPAKTFLDIISGAQLLLAAFFLIGRFLTYACIAALLLLIGLVLTNLTTFLITFRDIGLIAATIALMLLEK